MNGKAAAKILGLGLAVYVVRFALGGILYIQVGINPTTFMYGFWLTVAAGVMAYLLLKFAVKPTSTKEALTVAFVWVILALVIDMITAKPVINVPISYLFAEIQTWARVGIMLLVAPFTVKKQLNNPTIVS